MSVQHAIDIFNAGVEAVKPARLIPQYLQLTGNTITVGQQTFEVDGVNGIYVLSVGKAAAAMALEAEKVLGDRITGGLVVTKYHHALPLQYCTIIEAGHPLPDENSVAAADKAIAFLKQLHANDLLICCISGGASALLGDVAASISLDDLQQLSSLLLQCGADIHEINTVRKHISTLKGGRLTQQVNGAQVVSLIISDVPGDELSVIGSGLTVPDNSTFMDAFKVLRKYDLIDDCPLPITRYIIEGIRGQVTETPKPGDTVFNRASNNIIGSNQVALQAALMHAQRSGYHTTITNNRLDGDAETQAALFVQQLVNYSSAKPACLLMGGETTVTVKGNGKGGRNQQFVLACMCELAKHGIQPADVPVILSGGTDGTDGPTDATGAYISNELILSIQGNGLQPAEYLENNDAYNFFRQLNALLITGPTQTNVMDIVVALLT